MVDSDVPGNTRPTKRIPSFSSKRAGSVFVVIIILLIAVGQIFEWAKGIGISTFNHRDLKNSAFGIAFDSNDNLWVGWKENKKHFATVVFPDSETKTYPIPIPSPESGQPYIRPSIFVDRDNQVWAGGHFGLRRLAQRGNWVSEWDSNSFENDVYALAADQQGQLWVSTRDYLSRYVDGTRTDFPAEIAQSLTVDQQGRVWLLDRNDKFHYLKPDGNWEHSNFPIQALSFAVDADGRVWARIGYGIAVCNPDTQKCSVYRSYNSEIKAAIASSVMTFDNENRLWIPYGSLGYYRGGSFIIIDVDKILPVGLLNALWTSRLVLAIALALAVYFFAIRFFDKRKKDRLPEAMTRRNILKKNWLTLFVFGVVGPVVVGLTIGVLMNSDILALGYIEIMYIGFLGAAIMLTRLYSYRTMGICIAKRDTAESVIIGALISIAGMLLSFYTLFRLLMMLLISD